MKKSGIVAALLGVLCFVGSSAVFAQVKQVYWTTSGMFGPFAITGLIPTVPKEKQRDITIPVSMWVIDHPKGLVVFDTGINAAVTQDCKSYWQPGLCDFLKPTNKREEMIDAQLKKIGLSTDKVKVVITSHTHLDHVGNIKMFPNAIHVLQKRNCIKAGSRRSSRAALAALSSWPTWKAPATSTFWSSRATTICMATAAS